MSIIIYLSILVLGLIFIYLNKLLLGNKGVAISFITFCILSLVASFKLIQIGNMNLNANILTIVLIYSSLFIIIEERGKKEAYKVTNTSFILMTFSALICYMYSQYPGSIMDTIHVNLMNIFNNNINMLISFPISMAISNYIMIYTYSRIRKLYDLAFITLIPAYLLAGLIEMVLYIFITYYTKLKIKILIELILSNYMIGLITMIMLSFVIPIILKKKVKK